MCLVVVVFWTAFKGCVPSFLSSNMDNFEEKDATPKCPFSAGQTPRLQPVCPFSVGQNAIREIFSTIAVGLEFALVVPIPRAGIGILAARECVCVNGSVQIRCLCQFDFLK